MRGLLALEIGALWRAFWAEHASFWAICAYLLIEYVRPQSIIRSLDILPWAQLAILMSAGMWVLDPRKRWVRDPTNKWMVAFLCVIILASFTAYWPDISRRHFIDFFGWFVVYFLIINIVNNEKRFFIFLLLFLLASFKLAQHGARTWALRGFAFTDWGLMGPQGFFQNSGELAIQMLVFTSICYQFILGIRPWLTPWKFRLLMLAPLAGAMTILGSSTRGGQLALAVQTWATFIRGRLSLKSMVSIAILMIAAWQLLPEEQKARFSDAGNDETSRQRLLYWKNGVEMLKEHPFLGVGYFNFAPYFAQYYPHDIILRRAELPHNIFVQIGTDAGFIGLFVYLMLIYRAFRSTMDVRRVARRHPELAFYVPLATGFDLAFVGFLIAGQFVTVGYYPFMWIHLAMVVVMRNVVQRRYDELTKRLDGRAAATSRHRSIRSLA